MQTATIRRYKNLKIRLDLQRKNTRIVWGFKEFRIPVAGALTKWYNYIYSAAGGFYSSFSSSFSSTKPLLKARSLRVVDHVMWATPRVQWMGVDRFALWYKILDIPGGVFILYLGNKQETGFVLPRREDRRWSSWREQRSLYRMQYPLLGICISAKKETLLKYN